MDGPKLTLCYREDVTKSFDWFRSFAHVANELHQLIPNKQSRILMLGCVCSHLMCAMESLGLTLLTIRRATPVSRVFAQLIRATLIYAVALSQDMYDDGYRNIVNLDYSRICIEKMSDLHSTARPEMTWLEGDVRELPFEDGSFDIALDKGTMDAMMTSKGDVWVRYIPRTGRSLR